jgi:hypothetical protein
MSTPRLWPLTDCTTNRRSVLSSERVDSFHRNPCESTEKDPSSLGWDSNLWLWVLRDSDHWQIALQITYIRPLVREGAPRRRAKQLSIKWKEKRKIWLWAPKGRLTPRQIGRLTVGHNMNSTQHMFKAEIGLLLMTQWWTPSLTRHNTAYCRPILWCDMGNKQTKRVLESVHVR